MSAKTLAAVASQLSRGGANEAYKRTARDIVDELKSTWFNHEFSAIVYSSCTGPEQSDIVLYDGSEEDCVKETAGLFTAYVKRYTPEDGDRVQELWKSVREDPYALAGLFDDAEPSVNMTERFRKASLYAKIFDEGGFRAAAVIPCAYGFVWYELAWQYFHVYGTTSPYALTFKGENEYKPCGVVVLFP